MRKTFIALGVFMTVNSAPTNILAITQTQQELSSYAKWGQLAIRETQAKYPNANIIDYLHEGHEQKGESTIENFKLWLKEGDKEFGVFVRIEYVTATEKVIHIEWSETAK